MATERKRGFCKSCSQNRPVSRPSTNHILHLLLSIITCGLWIVVWILTSIKIGGWRCETCGSTKISSSI